MLLRLMLETRYDERVILGTFRTIVASIVLVGCFLLVVLGFVWLKLLLWASGEGSLKRRGGDASRRRSYVMSPMTSSD